MTEKSQEYLENRYRSGENSGTGLSQKIKSARKKWKASRFARKSHKVLKKTMSGVGQEATETKEMAGSFFRLLESKLNLNNRKEPPTEEEVKAAIEQLKDVGRFTFFSTISIIPGGGFSLIGLEILAKKLGVKNFTFVPSAFRNLEDSDTSSPQREDNKSNN